MLLRILFVSALHASVFLACAADATGSPFAGKWELDKKKTQAVGAPERLRLEIKPEASSMVIKSQYVEPKNAIYPLLWVGIMTYELPLATDGSETTNHIGPFTHVSRTTLDGNKMTTDWKAALENGQVEGQWVRTVSDDRREMTLQIIAKASDGRNMNQTLVFRRR